MARSIDRDEVQRLMGQGAQIVDVLPAREYSEDHLPGAVHMGKGIIERDVEQKVSDTSTPMIL